MRNPIELYKGDDTAAFGVRRIRILLKTDLDLVGASAEFTLLSFKKTWEGVPGVALQKEFVIEFDAASTKKFPLGIVFGTLRLFDADSKTLTAANRLAFEVKLPHRTKTGQWVQQLPDAEVVIEAGVDYNLVFNKPVLNGRTIEGDHDSEYYGISSGGSEFIGEFATWGDVPSVATEGEFMPADGSMISVADASDYLNEDITETVELAKYRVVGRTLAEDITIGESISYPVGTLVTEAVQSDLLRDDAPDSALFYGSFRGKWMLVYHEPKEEGESKEYSKDRWVFEYGVSDGSGDELAIATNTTLVSKTLKDGVWNTLKVLRLDRLVNGVKSLLNALTKENDEDHKAFWKEIGEVSSEQSGIRDAVTELGRKVDEQGAKIDDKVSQSTVDALHRQVTEETQMTVSPVIQRTVAIEQKIPSDASARNQLADKRFVNDAVQTSSGAYRGNWANWDAVPTNASLYPLDYLGSRTPNVNDYMIVADTEDYDVEVDNSETIQVNDFAIDRTLAVDAKNASGTVIVSAGTTLAANHITLLTNAGITSVTVRIKSTWRFKYTGTWSVNGKTGWKKEYAISSTSLTQAQLEAMNSGITEEKLGTIESDISTAKTKLNGIAEGAQVNVLENITVDGGSALPKTNKSVNINLSGKANLSDLVAKTNSTAMADAWTSGTAYKDNVIVSYNSVLYRCIARHGASSSNAPGTSGGASYWEVFKAATACDFYLALSDDSPEKLQIYDATDDSLTWEEKTNYQAPITASGMLKGDGSGGVSAATAGMDYQTPLTAGTDYIAPPSGGSVGDVLKKTANGVEWGQGGGGDDGDYDVIIRWNNLKNAIDCYSKDGTMIQVGERGNFPDYRYTVIKRSQIVRYWINEEVMGFSIDGHSTGGGSGSIRKCNINGAGTERFLQWFDDTIGEPTLLEDVRGAYLFGDFTVMTIEGDF